MVLLKRVGDIKWNATFENDDVLNRKAFWISLNSLIENSQNSSLVISINAEWWEGKSHFLDMWKNYLESDECGNKNVIYFNAFKNDFIEDPFIPLLWEIINEFREEKGILDKWTNLVKNVLPMLGKIVWRVTLGGDIESVNDQLETLIEGDIVAQIWKTLSEYSEKENNIKIFKETLESVIEKKGSLIFIIDELDRCRPDFAVRLLERIKHFFDIKWLYFVLWINKEQLEKYITNIYGNIDTCSYLRKFIDIETVLSKNINKDDANDHYKSFIEKCFSDYDELFTSKMEGYMKTYLKELFIDLSRHFNLSLRDIEKCFNYMVLFYKSTPDRTVVLPLTILFIIFMKVFNINIYKKMKEEWIKKTDFEKVMNLSEIDSIYKEPFNDEIKFIFDQDLDPELIKNYSNGYFRHSVARIKDLSSRNRILKNHFSILESYNI